MTTTKFGKEDRKGAAQEKKQLGIKEDRKAAKLPGKEAGQDTGWAPGVAGAVRGAAAGRHSV